MPSPVASGRSRSGMGQGGHGRLTRHRAWVLVGMLVVVVLALVARVTLMRPGAEGEAGIASQSSNSDGKPATPAPGDVDDPQRTGSWKSERTLGQQAQKLLADYRDEGRCVLTQAGYIDLAGRVWSCVVTGDGWVDLCVVRANEDGGSDVSVQRMEASSWEEEVDASNGADGDVA